MLLYQRNCLRVADGLVQIRTLSEPCIAYNVMLTSMMRHFLISHCEHEVLKNESHVVSGDVLILFECF